MRKGGVKDLHDRPPTTEKDAERERGLTAMADGSRLDLPWRALRGDEIASARVVAVGDGPLSLT